MGQCRQEVSPNPAMQCLLSKIRSTFSPSPIFSLKAPPPFLGLCHQCQPKIELIIVENIPKNQFIRDQKIPKNPPPKTPEKWFFFSLPIRKLKIISILLRTVFSTPKTSSLMKTAHLLGRAIPVPNGLQSKGGDYLQGDKYRKLGSPVIILLAWTTKTSR